VNRDAIDVEFADGELTIAASRPAPVAAATPATAADGADAAQALAPAEEAFAFRRSVSLADEVQADKVTAAYENGVLTVTLPKREEAKPRKVAVAVN
jgi:HSP20 family protein